MGIHKIDFQKMEKQLKVGSDYSGVGAFDQALDRLGVSYDKLFACDFDYNARLTYVLNFGTEQDLQIALSKEHKMFCDGMEFIILGYSEQKQIDSFLRWCKKLSIDGSDLETKKWNFSIAADDFATTFSFYYPFNVYDREIPEESLDIYMTSPPCQAFSLAGKRLGKADIKGILLFNSLEFIEKNRPKNFIFENVKGLLSDDKTNKKAQYGNTFQEWINYLGGKSVNGNPTFFPYEDSVPYHIYFKVLNAKDFGVPQNRERIFIIGIRDDEDNNFQFPKEFPLEKRLKDILEPVVDEKYFLSDKMLDYLTSRKDNFNNGKINFKDENSVASTITKSSSSLDISDNIIKVAQTLDTACNQGIFTQQRIRRLTPTECFRLMDFNDDMIEKTISSGLISDSQLYKQAGNSICVEPLKLQIQKLLKL